MGRWRKGKGMVVSREKGDVLGEGKVEGRLVRKLGVRWESICGRWRRYRDCGGNGRRCVL